jgi:hypothetical protein
MKKTLSRTWKLLAFVAVLTLSTLPLVGPSAQAIPGCGECVGGTTGSNYACGGAHSNCSECTVCAK